MDITVVIEEIALEGLDGITLDALWLRIKTRPGFYTDPLDDCVKEYVWKNLVACHDLEFFKLAKPRPELIIVDLNYKIPGARALQGGVPEDIYSIEKRDRDGIVGSCDDYETRVSLLEEIRGQDDCPLLTVQEANEKWGQQLVIVASQLIRFKTLFNTNFLPNGISAEAYLVVERVARSRYNGAITLPTPSGRGLVNKYTKSGCLFIASKNLCNRGYMRKQPFNIRANSGKICQARLLHMTHFYQESWANFYRPMEHVCQAIAESPDGKLEKKELMKIAFVREGEFKKHWSFMSKYLTKERALYRSVYPNAPESEFRSGNGNEKILLVYRVIRPFVAGCENDSDDDDDEDNEDADDDDDEDDDNNANKIIDCGFDEINFCESVRGPLYELSHPKAIQFIIEQAGPQGITEAKLCRHFGVHVKSLKKSVAYLLEVKTIIRVPFARGTVHGSHLVSSKLSKNRLESKLNKPKKRAPGFKMEGDADTSFGGLSGHHYLDDDQGYKDDDVDDRDSVEIADMLADANLDKTLSQLKLTWYVDRVDKADAVIDDSPVSDKKQQRIQYILKTLSLKSVCHSTQDLIIEMKRWETSLGMKEEMCRKSFFRIVSDLYKQGKVSYIVIQSDKFSSSQRHSLLADGAVEETNITAKKCVLQYYMKHFKFSSSMMNRDQSYFSPLGAGERPFSICEVLAGPSVKKEEGPDVMMQHRGKPGPPKANDYGTSFALTKVRMLHEYMFYLLYEYDPKANASGVTDIHSSALLGSKPQEGGTIDLENLHVFLDVQDWRRYIPPLKIHNTHFMIEPRRKGACMIGDLLMSMPIGMFCKIITITWDVPGLMDILNDPDLRLRPLFANPCYILQSVCFRRKYMWKLHEVLKLMCHMGLCSFGSRTGLKAMEYRVIYLHKKAMVLDTMTSLPGSSMTRLPETETEFPPVHFLFETLQDLDHYWNKIRLICLGTPLDHRHNADTAGFHGEITLAECQMARRLGSVREENWLPGDRRGAGGFDSSLFMHMMRKWDKKKLIQKTLIQSAMTGKNKRDHPGGRGREPAYKRARKMPHTKPVAKKTVGKVKKKAAPSSKSSRSSKPKAPRPPPTQSKPATTTTTTTPATTATTPKFVKSKTVLDEIDVNAINEQERLRCLYTPLENGIFLLCHIVSFLFRPKDLNIRLYSMDIRNIFRTLMPDVSKDKTSLSIKGKSSRMTKDENFINHMAIYIAKARYDEELMSQYTNFRFIQSSLQREPMYEKFFGLVKKLQVKFSSKTSVMSYEWPRTATQFHRLYEVKLALDMHMINEGTKPPAYFNVFVPSEQQAILLWDLILGWMHSSQRASNILIYCILCKYSEDAVTLTYNSLRKSRVMYMSKKFTYQGGEKIRNHTDMVNSLILSRRHKEALKSTYPMDLFLNTVRQVRAWENHWHHGEPDNDTPNDNNDATTTNEDVDGGGEEEDNRPPQGSKGQGHKGGEDGQMQQEQDGESTSLFAPLNIKEFYGGAVLALLPLIASNMLEVDLTFPDHMVHLNEEGMQRLSYKKSSKKRKAAEVLDTSLEESCDEKDYGLARKRIRRSCWESYNKKQAAIKESESNEKKGSEEEEDTSAKGKLKSMNLKYGDTRLHFNTEESDSSVLSDMGVSFASGTLLALSRTNMVNHLDLLHTKVDVRRFFIIDPLVMKFASKEEEGMSVCNNVSKIRGGEKEDKEDKEGEKDEAMEVCVDPNEKNSKQLQSESQPTKSGLSPSSKTLKPPPRPRSSSAKSQRRTKSCTAQFDRPDLFADILSQVECQFPVDFATWDVLQELEAKRSEDGTEWIDEGRSLFSLIDSFGRSGASVADLELKLNRPQRMFKSVIDKLYRMNAILRVGTSELRFVSRKYVKDWTIETQPTKMQNPKVVNEDEVPILFQSRPWRHPDGTLHLLLFHQLLHRIYSLLMLHPGTTLAQLTPRLNPDLLPMAVISLLSVLEELGCLDVKVLRSRPKTTIFGHRRGQVGPVRETEWFHEGCPTYDVPVCGPIRLAFFMEYLQQCPDWPDDDNAPLDTREGDTPLDTTQMDSGDEGTSLDNRNRDTPLDTTHNMDSGDEGTSLDSRDESTSLNTTRMDSRRVEDTSLDHPMDTSNVSADHDDGSAAGGGDGVVDGSGMTDIDGAIGEEKDGGSDGDV